MKNDKYDEDYYEEIEENYSEYGRISNSPKFREDYEYLYDKLNNKSKRYLKNSDKISNKKKKQSFRDE